MLSEEELILGAVGAACALLALGIRRLVRPSDARDPVRQPKRTSAPIASPAKTERPLTEARTGAMTVPLMEAGDRALIGLRVQGRYRIVAALGTTAFGTVCRAEDDRSGHAVAIRFLPRGLAQAPHVVQAVQRMSQSLVAASTTNPGLVRVLEFGEAENGRLFVVMELVEGRRLSEVLSDGKALDVGAALRLALDLGRSVETLHNLGIVHGALRPRNVLVLEDGRVKLLDVELAALRDALASEGVVAAKPPAEYRSPEQIQRMPSSEPADVYAFAVVLYEMLCGVPPFQAATREAVLAKHLTETPVQVRRRRRAVPVEIERIVARALDKQPEQRPLMQDFINVLKAGSSGPSDTRAHAPGIFQQLAERVKRLRPRRRGWWRWAEKRSIRNPMHEMKTVDDPHPIDRWLAESRDLLGRVIPTLIADRDRLCESLVAREGDCERLRKDLDDVSRDLGALRGEIERLRGERAAMAQAVADLLGQFQTAAGRDRAEVGPPILTAQPRSAWRAGT